jgi:hypothetical protein
MPRCITKKLILALIIMMMASIFPFTINIPEAQAAPCVHRESWFPDPEFLYCVSIDSGQDGSTICDADLPGVTSLGGNACRNNFSVEVIDDEGGGIEGIQYLTNLTDIDLSGNNISDLSRLSELTSLQTINLRNNSISDLSPMSGLTNVTTLDLGNSSVFPQGWTYRNAVVDTTPLNSMDNLTYLDLYGNNVSDLGGISGMSALQYLDLSNNNISDLSTADWSGLSSLQTLYLSNDYSMFDILNDNSITDISPLDDLTSFDQLLELKLNGNNIEDLSGVDWSGFTNIYTLDLGSNDISSITPLANADADFASGNSINVMWNTGLPTQANFQAALDAVDDLEANGATVTHDINWANCATNPTNDYCLPNTIYIDYGRRDASLFSAYAVSMQCGRINNPCSGFYAALMQNGGNNWITRMLTTPPYNGVTVYIKGTSTTNNDPEYLVSADPFGSNAVLPIEYLKTESWPGFTHASISAPILVAGPNITIQGYEISDLSNAPGFAIMGTRNLVLKNNYIHNMGLGIGIFAGKNATVENNIFSENSGTIDFQPIVGAPLEIPACGGVGIIGSDGTKFINNSLYNNCDEYLFIQDVNNPGNSAIKLGDITVASLSFLPISGTKNTTIEQNLVFNDITGVGAEDPHTYAYDLNGELVNGVEINVPTYDDTAAAHGDGKNFSEKITDPYMDAPAGGYDTAADDFTLTGEAQNSYKICQYDTELTPAEDFTAHIRPNGPLEAGAIESSGGSCAGGSGSKAAPVCSSVPVKIDLPKDLPVSYNDQGNPAVNLNWAKPEIDDINMESKIDILFEYLNQKETPVLGANKIKLKNIFARYMFDEISKSISPTLEKAFQDNIKYYTDRETENVMNMLASIGIVETFSDWWPYFAIHTLSNSTFASSIFTESLKQALPVLSKNLNLINTSPSEALPTLNLWQEFSSAFGNYLLLNLDKTSEVKRDDSNFFPVVQCIKNTTYDYLSADNSIYNPFEAKAAVYLGGGEEAARQAGVLVKMIDEASRKRAQTSLDKMLKDGRIESILASISSDASLIKSTVANLGAGFTPTFNTWKDSAAIRALVDFYQTDKNFLEYKNILFESAYFKKIESCIENNYRQTIIDLLKTIRYEVIQNLMANGSACSDDITNMMMDITGNLRDSYESKIALDPMILGFINNILDVEKLLSSAGTADVATPFTDFYNSKLAEARVQIIEGMTTEIYRDSKLIHSQDDPNITGYVDNDVPLNETGRVTSHSYYLITKTSCNEEVGSSGVAQVNPQIKPGTKVDVYADLGIIVKEGYSKLFMERLQELLQSSAENTAQLTSQAFGASAPAQGISEGACFQAKVNLLDTERTGAVILDYLIKCYGSSEKLIYKITQQKENFIPPLLLILKDAQPENVESLVADFMATIISRLNAQILAEEYVKQSISSLTYLTSPLLSKNSLADFNKNEKMLVKCLGAATCDQSVMDTVEEFFKGASHSAYVRIEKYDKDGKWLETYPSESDTPIKTDIFGEAKDVFLGEFISGDEYTLKIRLFKQNEKGEWVKESYFLPKQSTLVINSATPASSGYRADVTLKYDRAFQYGNFDESDDEINVKDIIKWGNILANQPELWDQGNLDGLYGIDLMDVVTLQGNWGKVKETEIAGGQISLGELAALFGLSTSEPETLQELQQAQTEEGRRITMPGWLYLIKTVCTLK